MTALNGRKGFGSSAAQARPTCPLSRARTGVQTGVDWLHRTARHGGGLVDDLLQAVGLGELGDDLVDLVADLLAALEVEHVFERATRRDVDEAVGVGLPLVRDVLDEQQREDVSLYWDASIPPRSSSQLFHKEPYRSDLRSVIARREPTFRSAPQRIAERRRRHRPAIPPHQPRAALPKPVSRNRPAHCPPSRQSALAPPER